MQFESFHWFNNHGLSVEHYNVDKTLSIKPEYKNIAKASFTVFRQITSTLYYKANEEVYAF